MAGTNTNVVVICGHLTADISLHRFQNGGCAGDFSVAVNRLSRDASGNPRESVSFIPCVVYSPLADFIAQYMSKGKQVNITGYLKQDRWQKDGQNQSRLRVVCERVEFLGATKRNGLDGAQSNPQQASASPQADDGDFWADSCDEGFPEEIPF